VGIAAENLAPIAESERISSIDVLRGAALLGIALMNVVSSGLPMAANLNPKVARGADGLNLAVYFLQRVLVDGKMRGLFSMMFGASAYLLVGRLSRQGEGLRAAEIYCRRLLWLMLFGVVHAYLIWKGDILYPYALLGLVLLPLLRARPPGLLIAAGVLVAIMMAQSAYDGIRLRHASGTELQEALKDFDPPAKDLEEEREMYRGSYFDVVRKRVEWVFDLHSVPFYWNGFDMLSMMLVGIAGVCLPLSAVATWQTWRAGFGPVVPAISYTNPLSRAGLTLAYAAGVLLVCKYAVWPGLHTRLAAVGKMAFSNYIAHSLVYGFVFYGYGLGLFDRLQRYQLYFVVLGMWGFSLIWSPLWLRKYRFGPLEWAWRSLTYWKRQPMRV
jgi:uncharacterized protein